ncbi:glucuronate isomerase [Salibacterium aidingense]|uniref:glucuronate isomerase n=1 Tax=Salibacterium aidingense TaxID=384933 RepID=UPI00146FBC22
MNSGFDSIADFNYAEELSSVLNDLEKRNKLPILCCLNPRDNYRVPLRQVIFLEPF